jgi:TRAP-type C4-dicarboxylate transport system substrate-binding protein
MAPIEIRFGGYQPPASVHTRGTEVFGRALAARLGDDVSFHFEPNIVAAGHKAARLLELVESGELSLCYFSTSYLAKRVPEFALLDLPFVLDDRQQAHGVLDGPLGRCFAERLGAATGFRLLGLWDNGFRHLSNGVRPIHQPGDCAGLRIRTLFSQLHARAFALMGFEPVALDVKDLLAGVQSGTIDAQENPLTNIFNFGIHKHHRFITLTGHFFGAAALLCHEASYQAWPETVQGAVKEAAAEATAAQRGFAAAEDDAVLAQLDPDENQVLRLSPEEREAFVEAVRPLVEEQRQVFGEVLFAQLQPGRRA